MQAVREPGNISCDECLQEYTVHRRKLTWDPKRGWEDDFLKQVICRFHVNFQGCDIQLSGIHWILLVFFGILMIKKHPMVW